MTTTCELDPRCSALELPEGMSTSMMRLQDDNLLTVKNNTVFI